MHLPPNNVNYPPLLNALHSQYDISLAEERELALQRLRRICRAGFISVSDIWVTTADMAHVLTPFPPCHPPTYFKPPPFACCLLRYPSLCHLQRPRPLPVIR